MFSNENLNEAMGQYSPTTPAPLQLVVVVIYRRTFPATVNTLYIHDDTEMHGQYCAVELLLAKLDTGTTVTLCCIHLKWEIPVTVIFWQRCKFFRDLC